MKTRHFISFALIFLLILCSDTFVRASNVTINNQSGKPGEMVTFTVTVDPSPESIFAFGFDLLFNSQVLEYKGFSKGDVSKECDMFDVSNPGKGVLRVGGISTKSLQINSVRELVHLNFSCITCMTKEVYLSIAKKVDDFAKWGSQAGLFTCQDDEQIKRMPTISLPLIISTSPESNFKNVATDIPIKVVFNQSMDHVRTQNAFRIEPHGEGKFEWSNNFTEMSFIPSSNLSASSLYIIHIMESASDLYGRSLDGDNDGKAGGIFSFSFTTAGSPMPLSPQIKRCFLSTLSDAP